MIGVAILGAGTFAREDHLPAIQGCSLFDLKAIYSRSQHSAQALVSEAKGGVESYFDTPETLGRTLDDLLARDDISAVVICVPILAQPALVRRALAAGKHVLSEKPIAPDVAAGRAMLEWYAALPKAPLWGVAENYRYVNGVAAAADKVRELGGKLVSFRLTMTMLITEEYKYLKSDWRRYPEHQGGMLFDGGIHLVACIRMLLSAANEDIKRLAAFPTQIQPLLSPVDTVHAAITTTSGATGTFHVSFGMEFNQAFEMEVVTTNGALTFSPVSMTVTKRLPNGEQSQEKIDVVMDSGVPAEIKAFGEGITHGNLDVRQSTKEAFEDVLVMESMLESGKAGGALQTLH